MSSIDSKIQEWVKLVTQKTNWVNYKIEIEGTTNNGDGFLGNISFVKITNLAENCTEKYLHLAIKSSKESTTIREEFPLQDCFEKEIYIYDTVMPVYDHLQKSKNVNDLLHFMPLRYASQKTGKKEVLILENLSIKGFKLWDKLSPMTFDHVNLCLEAYANWHAFAMALRAKSTTQFRELVKKHHLNMQSHFIIKTDMLDLQFKMYKAQCSKVFGESLIGHNKVLNFSKNDVKYALIDILFEDQEDHVILHGDSWNNNFMFRTKNNEERKPVEVKVVDWQCSGSGSPILDVSLFIYCCVDTKVYGDVKTLLQIYYNYLSKALIKLDVEPNTVFSFHKLLQHWKKYSRYGLILGIFLLKLPHFDDGEAPDFGNMVEDGSKFIDRFTTIMMKILVNEEIYIERIRNNFLHYVQNIA